MIISSRSFSALILLFICFFTSSRYIQIVLFDGVLRNNSIYKYLTSKTTCVPSDDSVLGHYMRNKKRVLIIVLDGYPDSVIYKKMEGKKSNLHKYIKSNSIEFKEGKTATKYTYKSIPYLLAKIDPKNNRCRYPFFNGNLKPNLLLASDYSGSINSVCQKTFVYENIFLKAIQKVKKVLIPSYRDNQSKKYASCSFVNNEIYPELISQIKNNQNSSNISFLHELKYHSWLENIKRNNDYKKVSKLTFFDRKYLEGIKYIHSNLKKYNLADELLVMSDHGPRLGNYGKVSEPFKENSLTDHDYFGYFIARIQISKSLEKAHSVLDLIPTSKYRFDTNKKGKSILLKNFQYN